MKLTITLAALALGALAAVSSPAVVSAGDNPAQVTCSDGYVAAGPYCVNPIYVNNPLFTDPATCTDGYYQGSCVLPETPAPAPSPAPVMLSASTPVCNPATGCVPPCNPATSPSCVPPCNPATGECATFAVRLSEAVVESVTAVSTATPFRPTRLNY